jgi:tetratricopeptide (TPR) repeat protein
LADVYRGERRYDEAEPLYKRAIAICEKAFGPEYPFVGTLLNNLATLYYVQNRWADAGPLYER